MTDARPSIAYRYWGKAMRRLEADYRSGAIPDDMLCKEHGLSLAALEHKIRRFGWRRADAGEPTAYYHLLPYHSLDVAAVAQILLQRHAHLRKHLSRLTGLSSECLVPWFTFFMALHDLGKFSHAFQGLRADLVLSLQGHTETSAYSVRHDSAGYMLWRGRILPLLRERGRLPPEVPRCQSSIGFWAQAVTGHHGQPPKDRACLEDCFTPTDIEAAVAFVTAMDDLLLAEVDAPPPDHTARPASWWLAGLAVLCDWLGSNRDFFPYRSEPMDLTAYWQTSLAQAEQAVAATELLPAAPARRLSLAELCAWDGQEPTPLQALCGELSWSGGPNVFILEDVTGAGKTEAALLLAHRLISEGQGEGLYFALPTMATANAMYERLGRIYQNLFTIAAKPSLILAHGARDLSAQFRQSILPSALNLEDDNGDETVAAGVHCSAWLADQPKKALLAEIGVGTIDQALLAVLPSRHQSLRLLGLLGKVLIVDEVHACDAYMNCLLRGLLRAHAMSGGSAILLSATLPQSERRELLKAFAEGCRTPAPDLTRTALEDYPLLTHSCADRTQEHVVSTRADVRRRVEVVWAYSVDEVEARIRAAIQQGKCVCWLRNTVVDAREAYLAWAEHHGDTQLELFHARYAMQDRLDIEARVLQRFGRHSTAADRCGRLLIATQVVEQSLDLDFDVMITDLAPIDLLIQRAGRLCRHRRDAAGNPSNGADARGQPTLIVHGPRVDAAPTATWFSAHFPKAGPVYPHHGQLWRTAQLLEERGGFQMPEDARALIEGVYGDVDYPAGLQNRTTNAEADRHAARSLGDLNVLDLPLGYGGGGDNLWWDEAVTPTRLGEETVEVYLARWQDGRLGPWVQGRDHAWRRSALRLRKALVRAEAPYPEIPAEVMEQTREALPARGKWGILVPLLEGGDGVWRGRVQDKDGTVSEVTYSEKFGFNI